MTPPEIGSVGSGSGAGVSGSGSGSAGTGGGSLTTFTFVHEIFDSEKASVTGFLTRARFGVVTLITGRWCWYFVNFAPVRQ